MCGKNIIYSYVLVFNVITFIYLYSPVALLLNKYNHIIIDKKKNDL